MNAWTNIFTASDDMDMTSGGSCISVVGARHLKRGKDNFDYMI